VVRPNGAAVCAQLALVLADPNKQLHYTPDIREIIISGNLAVVRLAWTLTEQRGSMIHKSEEAGIDIFRKQRDGSWVIIRYLTFSTDPD
jgi:ketosteroid isomerase-like protein